MTIWKNINLFLKPISMFNVPLLLVAFHRVGLQIKVMVTVRVKLRECLRHRDRNQAIIRIIFRVFIEFRVELPVWVAFKGRVRVNNGFDQITSYYEVLTLNLQNWNQSDPPWHFCNTLDFSQRQKVLTCSMYIHSYDHWLEYFSLHSFLTTLN